MNRSGKRVSGRPIVLGIIVFVIFFMVVSFILAYRLTPVAERWRSGYEPTTTQ